MNEKRKKVMAWAVDLWMAAVILVLAGTAVWRCLFAGPCRMEADCRGRGVEAGRLEQWEKQAQKESMGILNIAGWRVEEGQTVSSVSTRRRQRTQVIQVYGSMELVMPSDILDGRCGMDIEGDYCVISESLAVHLFGSTDVSGECIKTDKGHYIVAGVIKNEEDILMIPMKEGNVEQIAVSFKKRTGAEGNMKRVLEEIGG